MFKIRSKLEYIKELLQSKEKIRYITEAPLPLSFFERERNGEIYRHLPFMLKYKKLLLWLMSKLKVVEVDVTNYETKKYDIFSLLKLRWWLIYNELLHSILICFVFYACISENYPRFIPLCINDFYIVFLNRYNRWRLEKLIQKKQEHLLNNNHQAN